MITYGLGIITGLVLALVCYGIGKWSKKGKVVFINMWKKV